MQEILMNELYEKSLKFLSSSSGVIIHILSFLKFRVRFWNSDQEFFKYYFGRFSNGDLCLLFRNLEWNNIGVNVDSIRRNQIVRLEQLNEVIRFDELKCIALAPDFDKSYQELELLEEFGKFCKSFDCKKVKSVALTGYHPLCIVKDVLQRFTELEAISLNNSETFLKGLFKCKQLFSLYSLEVLEPQLIKFTNLKKLEISSSSYNLSNMICEISRHTPLMESFTCYHSASIFISTDIFENWKNIKEINSTIYIIRGDISYGPSDTDIQRSFNSIRQLKYLERMSLCDYENTYGVPYCASLTWLKIDQFYHSFYELLMETISQNEQLKVLKFGEGYWTNEIFTILDPQKLKNLTYLSIQSVSLEMLEHISKFSSLRKLRINYSNIGAKEIEILLEMPNLSCVKIDGTRLNSKEEMLQFANKF